MDIKFYLRLMDGKHIAESLAIQAALSLNHCAKQCYNLKECVTFHYNPQKECVLSHKRSTNVESSGEAMVGMYLLEGTVN